MSPPLLSRHTYSAHHRTLRNHILMIFHVQHLLDLPDLNLDLPVEDLNGNWTVPRVFVRKFLFLGLFLLASKIMSRSFCEYKTGRQIDFITFNIKAILILIVFQLINSDRLLCLKVGNCTNVLCFLTFRNIF